MFNFSDICFEYKGWSKIGEGIDYIFEYPLFIIGFVLFLAAIYGKNVTQMKVIEYSSALTRNLLMQLMPIGTWILSLVFYYIDPNLGEPWNQYSYIRLAGFVVVLIGSYLYMKVPKEQIEMPVRKVMSHDIGITSKELPLPLTSGELEIDLYGMREIPPPPSTPPSKVGVVNNDDNDNDNDSNQNNDVHESEL